MQVRVFMTTTVRASSPASVALHSRGPEPPVSHASQSYLDIRQGFACVNSYTSTGQLKHKNIDVHHCPLWDSFPR
jgi:hypothetical protein